MSKYDVPDGHWEEPDDDEEDYDPTSLQSIDVEVILTTDPTDTMGYGHEKYEAHVVEDDADGLYAIYVTEFRWKGNYWRDVREWDWRDVPGTVRQRVASVLACDGARELDPGCRVIGEGGRSTWREHERDGGDDE